MSGCIASIILDGDYFIKIHGRYYKILLRMLEKNENSFVFNTKKRGSDMIPLFFIRYNLQIMKFSILHYLS